MQISIGAYDAASRTVPVVFTVEGKEPFLRNVNAVLAGGAYDSAATKDRVEKEVAPGVLVKFGIGLVGNPAPEIPPMPEAE